MAEMTRYEFYEKYGEVFGEKFSLGYNPLDYIEECEDYCDDTEEEEQE